MLIGVRAHLNGIAWSSEFRTVVQRLVQILTTKILQLFLCLHLDGDILIWSPQSCAMFQESLQLHIIETPQVRCFPAGQAGYHTNLLTSLGCMFRPIRSESLTLKIHPNWWGQTSQIWIRPILIAWSLAKFDYSNSISWQISKNKFRHRES